MTSAASSKKRRRRGDWRFVFNACNQIIGLVEQRVDGQWRAVAASGEELGLATSPKAADLVREAARG